MHSLNREERDERPEAPSAGRAARAEGFSLIEVLAAAALLAGVMLSVMTMFIYGGQHINSGKLMTKATSIASDVGEQFRTYGVRESYEQLEDAGNPAVDTKYVWDSDAGGNVPVDADYLALLTAWKAQVEDELPHGSMTITVRGLAGLGSDPAEMAFAGAPVVQVVVTVRWKERRRLRSVVFETLKA